MLFRKSLGKDIVERTNWEISPNAKIYLRNENSDKLNKYNRFFPLFLIIICGIVMAIASTYPNQKIIENFKGCLYIGAIITVFWMLLGFYIRSNQMIYKKLELLRYSNEVLELTIDNNILFEIKSIKFITKIEDEIVITASSGLLSYTIFIPEVTYNKFLMNNLITKRL